MPDTPLDLDAIEARRQYAGASLAELCDENREWCLSIPPRDSDPDVVIDASLRDLDALLAEVRRLRERLTPRCQCGAVLRPERRERTTCRACQTARIREGVRRAHRASHTPETTEAS